MRHIKQSFQCIDFHCPLSGRSRWPVTLNATPGCQAFRRVTSEALHAWRVTETCSSAAAAAGSPRAGAMCGDEGGVFVRWFSGELRCRLSLSLSLSLFISVIFVCPYVSMFMYLFSCLSLCLIGAAGVNGREDTHDDDGLKKNLTNIW